MEKNIIESLWNRTEEIPDDPALITKEGGHWRETSFRELGEIVTGLASALLASGLKKGDKVAILSQTRLEWTLSDLSILTIGAITVPIYPTLLQDEVFYILENSDARAIFVEDEEQLVKVMQVRDKLPLLKKAIIFRGDGASNGDFTMSFKEFQELGGKESFRYKQRLRTEAREIGGDDLATIVYTSGTTGVPKGVMISHENIMFNIRALDKIIISSKGDRALAYLPLSHVFERFNQFVAIHRGNSYAFAESLEKMAENLGEIKPASMAGVPRVYEKIYQRINEQVEKGPALARLIFNWALGVGKRTIPYQEKVEKLPFFLSWQFKLANLLVFKKIKERLGGKVKYCICAAAPISKEILEFFLSLNIGMYEGYGMTETTAPTSMNYPGRNRAGTVGLPFPAVECRIAEDGEILIKGGNVFLGYYKMPEETKKTLEDGWLHTGDLGEIDEDGYLSITGRKKELIITSGAKHVAPNKLENLFGSSPYISQIVPYGDNRKYLTAIISINEEAVSNYARENEIEFKSYADLARHPKIFDLIKGIVEEKNRLLASFETIKKFVILDHDFSIESGELTPTLKVKKHVVYQRYKDLLGGMYEEE